MSLMLKWRVWFLTGSTGRPSQANWWSFCKAPIQGCILRGTVLPWKLQLEQGKEGAGDRTTTETGIFQGLMSECVCGGDGGGVQNARRAYFMCIMFVKRNEWSAPPAPTWVHRCLGKVVSPLQGRNLCVYVWLPCGLCSLNGDENSKC